MSKKNNNKKLQKASLDSVNTLISKESGVETKTLYEDWVIEHRNNVFVFEPKEENANFYFISNGSDVNYFSKTEMNIDEAIEEFNNPIETVESIESTFENIKPNNSAPSSESIEHNNENELTDLENEKIIKQVSRRFSFNRVLQFIIIVFFLLSISLLAISDYFGGVVGEAASITSEEGFQTACAEINIKNCEVVEVFDDAPRGTFLKQSEAPGPHLILPNEIVLTYSKGPENPLVPNLIGLTEKDAANELFLSGLKLGKILIEDDPTVEAGRVISTNSPQDTSVKNGDNVDITLSSDKVHLPDWTGLGKEEIELDANDKNILIKFEEEASDSVTPGIAIRQSVTSEDYDGKETVVITLSKAVDEDFIKIPEVIGKTPEMAQGLLISSGFTNFTIVEVENNVSEISVSHVVPSVGLSVGSGSNVVLIVSKPIE